MECNCSIAFLIIFVRPANFDWLASVSSHMGIIIRRRIYNQKGRNSSITKISVSARNETAGQVLLYSYLCLAEPP